MKSAIDIIKAANTKEPLRVEMELPGGVKCWLHFPNRHQISGIREKLYRLAYAEAVELGLAGKPINQAEWDKQLVALDDKEREEAEKNCPVDLAEQYAQAQSTAQAIYNLLPGLICDDAGTEIFPSLPEKREFLREVQANPEIENYLLIKWGELFDLKRNIEEQAKNS